MKIPPIMSAPIRFITSAPVPVAHRIGTSPIEGRSHGHKLGAGAPRRDHHNGLVQVSATARSNARSRYSSMNTPVSASTPLSAMRPIHAATLVLYPRSYSPQNAPTLENGTASSTDGRYRKSQSYCWNE